MATTTTNFGWDIPQSTDLVKDGATAIAALGQDIDTALVDLKGGTTGQYLTKTSGTDLDFTWATNTAITGATNMRSGQTYGIWGTSTNGTAVLNTTYYLPIIISNSVTLDRISCRTGSTWAGTGAIRLGIYNMDGTGNPSTVLLDAGTVAVTTASTEYTITISQAMTPGIYYLAACLQTAGTTNGVIAQTTLAAPIMPFNGVNPVFGYSQTGVTGAFATAGTLAQITNTNNISAKVRVA